MSDWRVIESAVEYETGWYTGGYDLVEQPDGSTKRYYWAELPPAAVVVARDGEEIVMVEQYRPTIREHCLELPAGIVEAGESYAEAGARELREETGLDPGEICLLEAFHVATGVLRHERGILFARDLRPAERDHDSNEFLTTARLPVEEALDAARGRAANDATLEGLLLAREEGLV